VTAAIGGGVPMWRCRSCDDLYLCQLCNRLGHWDAYSLSSGHAIGGVHSVDHAVELVTTHPATESKYFVANDLNTINSTLRWYFDSGRKTLVAVNPFAISSTSQPASTSSTKPIPKLPLVQCRTFDTR
jgi:hypothetical protein